MASLVPAVSVDHGNSQSLMLIGVLQPYFFNAKKRLIKSPKVYIRDSGLLHALLKIETLNDLLGHPIVGQSFESMGIENVLEEFPRHDSIFYRDSSSNEIDQFLGVD